MGSNIQEQLELFLNTAVQKKEEEIKTLKEANEKLKEENERLLKQISGISGDIKHKAENLKKALDDFLEHPNSNRAPYHPRFQHPNNFLPVSIPNSSDVKPSTSTRTDEPSVNGGKYHSNRPNFNNNSNLEDFSTRQEFRQETDVEIINAANPTDHHYHNSHSHSQTTLPTPYNNGNNSHKRFNPNATGFSMNNGVNNNNRNNNRNNNNNNNNSNKHTIFVSWPGTATKEQLQELFESENIDVADIRYTAQKQFAHVDLKSENAVSKAITLNGVIKNEKQGVLRVEVGKPRSSNPNPTENGQRPQNHQNKGFNRQNNKNTNGYNNTSSPQKQSKFNPYANHHNNNHHVAFTPTFGTTEDKENNNGWNTPNDITKSES